MLGATTTRCLFAASHFTHFGGGTEVRDLVIGCARGKAGDVIVSGIVPAA
jgi:hypothetical protein